jgi:tetratricopeptide (TPR) repeat protein
MAGKNLTAIMFAIAGAAFASQGFAQTDTGANAGVPSLVVKGDIKRKTGEWVRAESTHFIVYSDRAQRDVRTLLARLERFDALLRLYSGVQASQGGKKLEFYYLARDQAIDQVSPDGPQYTIGLYRSCAEGTQAYGVHMYYDAASQLPLEKKPENEGFIYIFQAYARHFFYEHSAQRVPVWFIEGYAEFFSTARFEDNQAVVGMAAAIRARHLSLLGNGMRYKLNYKDIVLQNEREGIFDPERFDVVSEYSSKSWLLTHYILSSKDNLTKFRAYLAGVQAGQKPEAAFEAAFGFKIGKLDGELAAYMRRNLFASKLVFKDVPDANIAITPLPAGIEPTLMARSRLEACPGKVAGGNILQALHNTPLPRLGGAVEDDLALLTRARAEIDFGDPQAAVPWLDAVLKARPNQLEALYLSGKLNLALASKADAVARATYLKKSSDAFEKTGNVDPGFSAGAFYWYRAQMAQADKPDETTLAAGVMASQLAPDVDAYAVHAGLIYAYLGRLAEAKAALNTVAGNPLKGPMTVVARDWLGRLDKGASADVILLALKTGFAEEQGARLQWTYAASDALVEMRARADQELNGDLPPATPPTE